MTEVLLIILGASIALMSAWTKSWIERESVCSNEIYKQRITFLNKIWCSFYEVKNVYGAKVSMGHENWINSHREDALNKLNAFRRDIDESQIVLSKDIVSEFRELDSYLFTLLDEEEQKPSEYVKELNVILKRVSKSINENMNKRVYKIDLHLRT